MMEAVYLKQLTHFDERNNRPERRLNEASAGDVAIKVDADRVLGWSATDSLWFGPLMRGLRLSGGRFTGKADPTRLPRRVVATLTGTGI